MEELGVGVWGWAKRLLHTTANPRTAAGGEHHVHVVLISSDLPVEHGRLALNAFGHIY